MSHYSYPLNDERERLIERVKEASDANTKADAIDAALRHYREDMKNRQDVADEIAPETMKKLNTSELKVSYYPKVR